MPGTHPNPDSFPGTCLIGFPTSSLQDIALWLLPRASTPALTLLSINPHKLTTSSLTITICQHNLEFNYRMDIY